MKIVLKSILFGIVLLLISIQLLLVFDVYAVNSDPFVDAGDVVTSSILLDDLVADSLGNWYVSFQTSDLVKKYNSNWIFQYNVCTGLDNPQGLALDSNDNLWVANYGNYGYVQCDTTIPDTNISDFTPQPKDTGCSQANDNRPSTLAIDNNDLIYISLFCGNTAVITYDTSGVYQDKFIDYTHFSICQSGKAFSNVLDIHIDSDNNIYVSDSNCSRIQKFNQSGTLLQTFTFDDYPIIQSAFSLSNTSDLFVIAGNRIITNNTLSISWDVNRFSNDGTFVANYADGLYLEPRGIFMDAQNNFYITTGFDGDVVHWKSP